MKQRIITGTLLATSALLLILFAPFGLLTILLVILSLLASREWATLLYVDHFSRLLYQLIFCLGVLAVLVMQWLQLQLLNWYLMGIGGLWLLMPYMLWQYQRQSSQTILRSTPFLSIWTLCSTLLFIAALCLLIQYHRLWLIAFIAFVAIADSGAYFCGRLWGKHKLAPLISPGKTQEGALGGVVLATFFATVVSVLYMPFSQAIWLIVFSPVLAAISITGDLFESVVKRKRAIKDSGNLLPGHGGIVDRIDALIASAPLLVLLLGWVMYGK